MDEVLGFSPYLCLKIVLWAVPLTESTKVHFDPAILLFQILM